MINNHKKNKWIGGVISIGLDGDCEENCPFLREKIQNMNHPAASNGVSIGNFYSPQGAGN
jgi:hypothetical protein